ncbi:putative intracellular protease/amidase [Lysobacter sp. HA18]
MSYEPNSLAGGCPFQAGGAGFVAFPEPVEGNEVRGKPEKFAEHFNQARLFFDSQTPIEQAHIIAAFRFELSKVTVPAVRERVVSMLANVSDMLAEGVAAGLGMDVPEPMPPVLAKAPKPEVTSSDALSLLARPGDGSIRTRQIALVVADGVDGASVTAMQAALLDEGAVPRLVGPRIGPVRTSDGGVLDADASLENEPAFLFDAIVLPDGAGAVDTLLANGRTLEGLKDQYRHCKTILALGESQRLVAAAGLPTDLPDGSPDPGLLLMDGGDVDAALEAFVQAVAMHRHWDRETDPPRV